jgi:pimeloyl-ACP methyl ester carboxylesterase
MCHGNTYAEVTMATDKGAFSASASAKPTVVLVHGTWGESSSWSSVLRRLRADGYPVWSIANPLRGLTSDTAYVFSYLPTIKGPVVLVGHSCGGAVITNSAASGPEVKALVYIAGFIPAKGETVGDLARPVVTDRSAGVDHGPGRHGRVHRSGPLQGGLSR